MENSSRADMERLESRSRAESRETDGLRRLGAAVEIVTALEQKFSSRELSVCGGRSSCMVLRALSDSYFRTSTRAVQPRVTIIKIHYCFA